MTVTLWVVEACLISSSTLQLCEEKANSFAKFAVGKHHLVVEKQARRRVALAGINSHTDTRTILMHLLHHDVCQITQINCYGSFLGGEDKGDKG